MLAHAQALRALACRARATGPACVSGAAGLDRLRAPLRRSSFDARAANEPAGDAFEVLRGDDGNTGKAPPTEKQISFAQTLAQQRGIPMPSSATKSKRACSTFIEESQALISSGRPTERQVDLGYDLPTERQLDYARRIAAERGMTLSAAALSSRKACSDWIDRVPPSPKQVQFAKAIAERRGLELPPEVLTKKRTCEMFLDSYQQKSLTSNAAANRPPWASAAPQRRPLNGARTEHAPPHGVVDTGGLPLESETLAVLHKLANATATSPSRPSLIQLLTGLLVAQEHAVGLPREALQSFRQVLHPANAPF
jgi:hypothetical protein